MSLESLLPDVPRPLRRYTVTVTAPRPDGDGDDALLPPGGHAMVQLVAAAVAADGLVPARTCSETMVSMMVKACRIGDALETGLAVARVLDSGDGTVSVTAEPAADRLRRE
jgi:hypothetical protein